MTDKKNIISMLNGIIHYDECQHCFEEYIRKEINIRYNNTIENDILDLMKNGEEEIKETLSNIILNMASFHFKNEKLVKMIDDKFNEDTKDIDFEDLY